MKKKLVRSGDIGSFNSFPSKFFVKLISRFKSFPPNKYELRIISSVISDRNILPPGKRAEIREELLLNHYRKSITKFYEVAGHVD